MKRFTAKAFFALALVVVMVLGLGAPAFAASASVSTQKLTVNGETVECEKYTIDGYNYFKLRDLAQLLNGTTSQFDVDYDKDTKTVKITTDHAYTTPDGTELKIGADKSDTAVPTAQTVMIDGEVRTDLTAYNIGGNNYFKLRELGKVLHYYVDFDKATNTAKVKEQREEEDWGTGDASLDNPRNQDGIGETELLIVSFGTSFNNSRVATIGAIENAMEKAFPDYSVRRGFTAQIIIDHVFRRDGEKIDNFGQALDRAVANGVQEILIQPTHLMDGYEYNDVVEELKSYKDKFQKITIGKPILTTDADYDVVIKAITEATKEYDDGKTAICFMGHGTEAASNHVYADMQAKLTAAGYKNYFIGTVESTPTLEEVVEKVKAAGYTKAVLEPLMIVAGDHANNDMADPEDPESWYSLFAAKGIEVTCLLRGLGEFPAIQQLLVEHAKAAEVVSENASAGTAPSAGSAKEVVPTGEPTRDIADKTQMITATEVLEEGMTPVTADKIAEGVYPVAVKSSSSMFRITSAVLTVKDGKMSVEFSLSGKSYTWMFAGSTDSIAAADKSEFIPAMKDADDVYYFTLPVEALDQGLFCAAYSKNKDQWYARTLLVRADSLPAGALK